MNVFKSYTYTWWQIGIFKVALIAAGVVIGTYWHDFFQSLIAPIVIIWLVSTAYIMYVSLK